MNAESFYRLLENPGLLNADSLLELEQLILVYPNSENIKILYALNLLKEKHFKYQESLTKAAFYASSRRKLKYWIDFIVEDDSIKEIHPTITLIEDDIEDEVNIKPLQIAHASDKKKYEDEKTEKLKIQQDEIEKKREKEQHKKDIRTKSELLALVRKRLAEIEISHQEDQESSRVETKMINKAEKAKLIDQFINSAPSISRPDKADFYDPQQEAVNSAFDDDDFLVTETLARIHTDQGNSEKAREIYEKLILKFPKKSSYFAALIQDLKK